MGKHQASYEDGPVPETANRRFDSVCGGREFWLAMFAASLSPAVSRTDYYEVRPNSEVMSR